MDTKFKKTALDDDAYLYQKTSDTISREDLKKLSKKQKLQYFKDYYLKKVILGLLIAAAAINVIYTTVFKRSTCVLSISVLNSIQIEKSEDITEDLRDYLEVENKNDYIDVAQYNLENYQMNMAFATKMAAGTGDIIICSYEDFQDQASKGMFADLREFLPAETFSAFSGQLMEASLTEVDTEGNILSTEPEQPFGIDISDSAVFKKYSSSEQSVLCVVANTENPENVMKAISFLTDAGLTR